MHRYERRAWMVLAALTAALCAIAFAILARGWWVDRRIAECRDGLPPGGDAWSQCARLGDWN